MVYFYAAITKYILTSSVTIWCAAAAADRDKGRLQRISRSPEKMISCNLPSPQDLQASRTLPTSPGHKLLETLPSIGTKTSQNKNSFFPSATSLFNKATDPL